MQRILLDLKIGGFYNVQVLLNSDSDTVGWHMEELFKEKCQKDDIVLLYFSGHRYRDEDGSLFFLSHKTRTNSQRRPAIGTAIGAKFIHDRCMSRSKGKRQVIILYCCFSGAFAKDMNARQATTVSIEDEIKQQLGVKGGNFAENINTRGVVPTQGTVANIQS
ncbi:MAG: caspase family protein [Richelia sp.]|nr:caspase family protein [Richelia sp.]